MREPKRKIVHPDKVKETKKTVVNTNDWSNIPYYPTNRDKRINVAKYLTSMGKEVPESLLKQIAEDARKEIDEDAFNKIQMSEQEQEQEQEQEEHQHKNNNRVTQVPHHNFNHYAQQQVFHPPPPPNKYSPLYASYIGHRPRAQASARVRLGGVY